MPSTGGGDVLCSEFRRVIVFVSWSYHSRLPHTWWFKTTEFHSLTVLGARGLKSGCPSDGSRGGSLLLAAVGGAWPSPASLWLTDASPQSLPFFLRMCLSRLPPSYKDTRYWIRTHVNAV